MHFEWFYSFPIFSGMVYALSAVFSKRALEAGAGMARLLFVTNLFFALGFLPLAFFRIEMVDWGLLTWPLLAGSTFFVGQALTFLAIRAGDVSIQGPVMGTKAIFVALFAAWLFNREIPSAWWWAAFLTAGAVFLLGWSGWSRPRETFLGMTFALLSAVVYGFTDAIVAEYAKPFGTFQFLGLMMATSGLLSFSLVPFFRAPLRSIPEQARPWFFLGGFCMALQAVSLGSAIAFFQEATAINIFYSTRGVWSILFVWMGLTGQSEGMGGRRILILRLAGALVMIISLVLVVSAKP